LGFSFLSAVADRFGLWGAYGQPNVAWGDFARFVAYTGKLNWFVPAILIPALAWASTVAEILLGFALVLGLFTRIAALLSGMILLLFAACASSPGIYASKRVYRRSIRDFGLTDFRSVKSVASQFLKQS